MPRCVPVLFAFALFLSAAAIAHAADAPTQLAGITLGANAEDLRDRLDITRMAPLWDRPWLIRANLKPTKGFAAGYVILGGCATANRVERVRMQYKDGSKAMFDKVAKALTSRYGVPVPILGPKAGKYKGLRWVFGPNKNKGQDLLLEHFDEAAEDNPSGNVLRISDNRAMIQERTCYENMVKGNPEPQPAFPLFDIDDAWLLPK